MSARRLWRHLSCETCSPFHQTPPKHSSIVWYYKPHTVEHWSTKSLWWTASCFLVSFSIDPLIIVSYERQLFTEESESPVDTDDDSIKTVIKLTTLNFSNPLPIGFESELIGSSVSRQKGAPERIGLYRGEQLQVPIRLSVTFKTHQVFSCFCERFQWLYRCNSCSV